MKTGWVTKRLGEVCEEIRERIASANILPRQYVGTENMLKDCAGIVDSESVPKDVGLVHYQNGDILLSNIRPYLKKSWLSDREGGCSSDVIVFRPSTSVAGEYLWRVLSQDSFFDYSMLKVGGAKMPRGDRNWIKAFEFSYPDSLAEQKRIVAKIDAAFEKIDRLKANAERNLANAKELFQSALNEAMRPKPGWVEKRLGEIGPVCMCKRVLKSDTNPESGVPFYKIGTFGKKANAFISNELYQKFRSSYKFPKKGDVLISAAGTIGRTVVYDGEPAYFQDSNIVWIANDETEVLNAYLLLCYATSPWSVTKGATIPRLYNENIEQALIAFPSVHDQRTLVREFADLRSNIETLQSNYTRLMADCAEMRQAVLKEAFEGRL